MFQHTLSTLFGPFARSGNMRGMLLMVIATLAVTCMQIGIRRLYNDLHPFEIAFFRNLFGAVALTPFFLRYGVKVLASSQLKLHGLRGILNIISMMMWFTAVGTTGLAQIAALSFAAPLFATLFAMWILKERVPPLRWVVLACGFVGMLVILRPGVAVLNTGALLVVGSATLWAATLMVIKVISRTDSSITTTAYMSVFMTPMALLAASTHWIWPNLEQLGWLAGIGALGTTGQLCVVQSLREAEASLVLPLDFTKLLWSALFGFLLFGEVPDAFIWMGGVMIFASSTYLVLKSGTRPPATPSPVGK